MANVVVTGGAGFIGSHIVDALIENGHRVVAFDNLDPGAHTDSSKLPSYANPQCQYVIGDVRDKEALRKALEGTDVIIHQAAAVGSGVSMIEVKRFVEVNSTGTAGLLEVLIELRPRIRKLIVASSMTVMGEGTYQCTVHGLQYPFLRPLAQLKAASWEVKCGICGAEMTPLAMKEERPLLPLTVYGLTKMDEEKLCLLVGGAYGIPTVAFRYFSVYGPRQSLTNPYTGVIARFGTRLISGKPPIVYEDGNQLKDAIHVRDVVRANLLAMERDSANYEVLNLGSGIGISVRQIATLLAKKLGEPISPVLSGQFRSGDARHGWADISKARAALGWEPEVSVEDGFEDLCRWLGELPRQEVEKAAWEYEQAEKRAEGLQLAL